MSKKLTLDFYEQGVVEVARNLLGKEIFFNNHKAIITETEAYGGSDDEASHAYKRTPRSSIMFGPAGIVYVYMIYGMYYCFNIVTQKEGHASAILIRSVQIEDKHVIGPGRLCRYLSINKEHNGLSLLASNNFFLTEGASIEADDIIMTPRIGIRKAVDKEWRFVLRNVNSSYKNLKFN